MKLVCVAVLVVTTAGRVFAEPTAEQPGPPRAGRLELPGPETWVGQTSAVATAERRDSLKNGALIGALIGAGALGGFGLFLCEALKEPGDPSCWGGTLVIAGIGAGIGAAAGVGVDALLMRGPAPLRGLPAARRITLSWHRRF